MKILIILLAFVAVFLLIFGKYIWKGLTVQIVSVEYKDEIMTFTYDDGSTMKFKGECTVWHRLPSFKRCSTLTEARLADYWEMCRHHGGKVILNSVEGNSKK